MISIVKIMPLRVDVHSHLHIRIEFIGLPKICAIFAVLTDNLMLTNYFTNNLYGLSYRAHTPGTDVAYS